MPGENEPLLCSLIAGVNPSFLSIVRCLPHLDLGRVGYSLAQKTAERKHGSVVLVISILQGRHGAI